MTTIKRIADRYSLAHPGLRLLGIEPAAIPFYWLTLQVVIIKKRPITPLEEYVLQSVSDGLHSIQDLAGILGVGKNLVMETATKLFSQDLVEYPIEQNGERRLQITNFGKKCLEEFSIEGPQTEEYSLGFDRILWEPIIIKRSELFEPKLVKENDWRQLRPAKKGRPQEIEIPLVEVNRQLNQKMKAEGQRLTVLSVMKIERAESRFLPCHLLIYGDKSGEESLGNLNIEEHASPRHDQALASLGGLQHLGIVVGSAGSNDQPDSDGTSITSLNVIDDLKRQYLSDQVNAMYPDLDGPPEAKPSFGFSPNDLLFSQVMADLSERELDTYEQKIMFDEAIRSATSRLLIIAPFISGKVVNRQFIETLKAAARRGVEVHIGWGISNDELEDSRDQKAEALLLNLSKEFKNIVAKKLGNTHAKILIWDNSKIVGSYNWFSFEGSRKYDYRQEEGTFSMNRHAVELAWQKFSAQISQAND